MTGSYEYCSSHSTMEGEPFPKRFKFSRFVFFIPQTRRDKNPLCVFFFFKILSHKKMMTVAITINPSYSQSIGTKTQCDFLRQERSRPDATVANQILICKSNPQIWFTVPALVALQRWLPPWTRSHWPYKTRKTHISRSTARQNSKGRFPFRCWHTEQVSRV